MGEIAPTVAPLVALQAFDTGAGWSPGPLAALALALEESTPHRLLSPIDLQCVKAAGVTFAVSAIERVIEEKHEATMLGPPRCTAGWRSGSAAASAR